MWTHGVDNAKVVRLVQGVMGSYGFDMWGRAGREISAAYRREGSPLKALARIRPSVLVLHLYAQPDAPSFLEAQEKFSGSNPWFSAKKLNAKSHFPMLELPEKMAEENPLTEKRRSPLQAGDRAPEFTLPAVDREATVSLADYRGRTSLLLGLFRATYCPFCRRAIVRMGQAAEWLRAEGVGALAIVATTPENARFYFRFRPPRLRVGADPEFVTHRLYGVPGPRRTDIEEVVRTLRGNPTGDLPAPLPAREASAALSRLEGFEPTPTDREDATRPYLQFLGQFLVDREGIIRWTNIECAREGPAGLGQFPTDEELLAAVRALPR